MFHFDRGLKLTKADLAIDIRRRQPRAFVSHAHSDHIARHQLTLCTPETAKLYCLRLGRRETVELPYYQPLEWGGLRLTTFPAGHCLGSAMLLAEDDDLSLLYTGDFKLTESATVPRADPPRADILVIESTYGDPQYRHMPRDEAVGRLVSLVREILHRDATPVIQAYALGKSQEVTRLLTRHGIGVLQHTEIHQISRVYEQCGVELGPYELFRGQGKTGYAVIVPPGRRQRGAFDRLNRVETIAVTGWATDPTAKYRLGVDHAIPLSDHADFDDLCRTIERVAPRETYCTHGPETFVDWLRKGGVNAFRLGAASPSQLF